MDSEWDENDLLQKGHVDSGDPGVNAAVLQASDNSTSPPGCLTVTVLGLLGFCDVEFLCCKDGTRCIFTLRYRIYLATLLSQRFINFK